MVFGANFQNRFGVGMLVMGRDEVSIKIGSLEDCIRVNKHRTLVRRLLRVFTFSSMEVDEFCFCLRCERESELTFYVYCDKILGSIYL